MADISKIQIESGTYDIKDETARDYINNNMINVKLYGVKGDGITDDSTAIQSIIDNNPHSTLYFPKGIYIINTPLSVKQNNDNLVSFKLDNYAMLKSSISIESLIELGFNVTDGYYDRYYKDYKVVSIDGGIFNCENVTNGIKIQSRLQLVNIRNCKFTNIKEFGIYIVRDTTNNVGSSNTKILNCHFMGRWSNTSCTAIYSEAGDNEIDQVVIDCCKNGIVSSGGDLLSNIHITVMFDPYVTVTPIMYEETVGFWLKGTSFLTNCYADTCGTGFLIDTSENIHLDNCFTFHYMSVINATSHCIRCNNQYPHILVSNSSFNVPSQGNNHYLTLTGESTIKNINADNTVKLNNILLDNSNTVPNNDLMYCLQLNNESGITPYYLGQQMIGNNYYPLCILQKSNNYYDFIISNDGDMSYHIKLTYNDNPSFIEKTKIYGYDRNYELAVVNEYVSNGVTYGILVISPSTNVISNVSISDINKNCDISMFGHKFSSPSPITITSTNITTTL